MQHVNQDRGSLAEADITGFEMSIRNKNLILPYQHHVIQHVIRGPCIYLCADTEVRQKLRMLRMSVNMKLAWCKYPVKNAVMTMLFHYGLIGLSMVYTCKANTKNHIDVRARPRSCLLTLHRIHGLAVAPTDDPKFAHAGHALYRILTIFFKNTKSSIVAVAAGTPSLNTRHCISERSCGKQRLLCLCSSFSVIA